MFQVPRETEPFFPSVLSESLDFESQIWLQTPWASLMQNVWGLGVILRYHFENQHICPLVAPCARAKSLSLQLPSNSAIHFLRITLSRRDFKLTLISSKQFPPLSGCVLHLTLQLHMCQQWSSSHWEVHWHLCACWFALGKSADQRRKQDVFFSFSLRWNVQTIKSKQQKNGMLRFCAQRADISF